MVAWNHYQARKRKQA